MHILHKLAGVSKYANWHVCQNDRLCFFKQTMKIVGIVRTMYGCFCEEREMHKMTYVMICTFLHISQSGNIPL